MAAWLPLMPRSPGEDGKLCPATPLKANPVTLPQRRENAVETGRFADHKVAIRAMRLTRWLLW